MAFDCLISVFKCYKVLMYSDSEYLIKMTLVLLQEGQ